MNVHQKIGDRKLTLQRLQMIETREGMLLKRGRAVVKIKGAENRLRSCKRCSPLPPRDQLRAKSCANHSQPNCVLRSSN